MGGYKQNVEMVAWPKRFQYDVPFLTHDAAGFRIIGSNDNGEELFIRWIQFSLFNPVTEIFQSLFNSHANLAWQFSPRANDMFVELSHLKMRLFPYIYSYAHLTRQTGKKMIQGDGIHRHQYLFGNELLVGPVVDKGAVTKEMFFPEGKWFDYYSGKQYDGNQSVKVEAPLTRIPLFVRAGAIIPMREYARSVEMGTNNRLTLDVYPSGHSGFTLFEDDGTSNDYLTGGFATTKFECKQSAGNITFVIHPFKGSFNGMPVSRNWTLKINQASAPKSINLNNRTVRPFKTGKKQGSGWLYNENANTIEIVFSGENTFKQTLIINFQ
jgi:alpha-glucosidase (family GH31 glycosyl hydrolase)